MMGNRHATLGIKQSIRLEWMRKTTDLLLAGLAAPAIRKELLGFLADKKGDGSADGGRSQGNLKILVTNLMSVWVSPPPELLQLRDALLAELRETPSSAFAAHWAMTAAVYPFWYNVAKQAGRLLALQGQVTQRQIVTRLKEQYGDRPTVSRNARYVIRSFVAWGALRDSAKHGSYEQGAPVAVPTPDLTALMYEAALWAMPEGKSALGLLMNAPAFFPFQFPALTGDFIAGCDPRLEAVRHGIDEELLQLRGQ